MVQTVLYWLQSISIPIVCTVITYNEAMQDARAKGELLTSEAYLAAIAPATAVLLLSFVLARCFATVYEQVVSALTVCVLNDINNYNCMYTPQSVLEAFQLDKVPIDKKDATKFQVASDAPMARVKVRGTMRPQRHAQGGAHRC